MVPEYRGVTAGDSISQQDICEMYKSHGAEDTGYITRCHRSRAENGRLLQKAGPYLFWSGSDTGENAKLPDPRVHGYRK